MASKTIMNQNHHLKVLGAQVRRDTFEGRPHLIVPVVILTEGVHHGSGGRILYTAEEMSKFPDAWNGRPIPVFHPTENGEPVSVTHRRLLNSKPWGNFSTLCLCHQVMALDLSASYGWMRKS
ncbi:hypothetical protein LCGC14_0775350 [marine sediment metagenome]|uniref:Uncharacterized protein n=1 Tax=marine sediment metagenome TaxID=412755 RepID=A0A0F9PX68_9ZZZZ